VLLLLFAEQGEVIERAFPTSFRVEVVGLGVESGRTTVTTTASGPVEPGRTRIVDL
jgi:hypothetical protein